MAIRSLLVLGLASFLAWPSPAWAGAWARERAEVYAKASASRLDGDEMYDASGNVAPLFDPALYENARYGEVSASLYMEYGLWSALTLTGSLPLKAADQKADGMPGVADLDGETFGFGDAHFGTRVPLHRGRWAAALECDLKIPLYGLPDAGSFDPALGTGFVDFGASLSVGASLPGVAGYGQGSFGYRVRGGSTAEETYWDLEVGLEPANALRLRFRYDGVDSQAAEAPSGSSTMGAPVPSAGEQDYQRIAPTAAIAFGGGQEFSLTWRKVVDGRSTIRSSEWEVAYAFLGRFLPAATAVP